MTLSEAKTYLAALESAILRGVKSVDRAGRSIEYADLEDMQLAADRLRRDIYRAEGKPSTKIMTWTGVK